MAIYSEGILFLAKRNPDDGSFNSHTIEGNYGENIVIRKGDNLLIKMKGKPDATGIIDNLLTSPIGQIYTEGKENIGK